jgi:hypothetical protein
MVPWLCVIEKRETWTYERNIVEVFMLGLRPPYLAEEQKFEF